MRILLAGAVALLVCFCGCGPSSRVGGSADGVDLGMEPSTVSAGDSVTLILTNHGPDAVGYNLCTSELQRRAAEAWSPVPSDRVCTMELRTLPAGEEARFTARLPAELAAGEYRYRATVYALDTEERRVVGTDPFSLGG